jgi:hypothetical protein
MRTQAGLPWRYTCLFPAYLEKATVNTKELLSPVCRRLEQRLNPETRKLRSSLNSLGGSVQPQSFQPENRDVQGHEPISGAGREHSTLPTQRAAYRPASLVFSNSKPLPAISWSYLQLRDLGRKAGGNEEGVVQSSGPKNRAGVTNKRRFTVRRASLAQASPAPRMRNAKRGDH